MSTHTIRPHARMVLLILLRHWQEQPHTDRVIADLRAMGFTGMALTPEVVEVVVSELERRIWEIDLVEVAR